MNEKTTTEVFCAWGDGPDVGINIHLSEDDYTRWVEKHRFVVLDFTASEAREFAAKMIVCAEQSEALERSCLEHDSYDPGDEDQP